MASLKGLIHVLKNNYPCAREIQLIMGGKKFYWYLDLLWANLRYGANAEDYIAMHFYEKNSYERNKFNTSRRNFKYLFKRVYDKSIIDEFDNKVLFNKRFAKYIHRDWLCTADGTVTDVLNFINRYKNVVVKPVNGCEGIGVFLLSAKDTEKVSRLLSDVENGIIYIVEQLVINHELIRRLNPSSLNTIRVETMIDAKGVVHVTNTIIIMGTSASIVNNTHSGGIMCHVDLSTGIIDTKATNPKGENFFIHPVSGIVLPGYEIPNWNEVLEYTVELAKVEPRARYIGWDIAITPNGLDVIEGNVRPGHCTQACLNQGNWDVLKSYI